MAKKPGSLWVEGNNLHYVDNQAYEWMIVGTAVLATGAKPGSLWIEPDGLHYMSATSYDMLCPPFLVHNDAAAKPGSFWIEGSNLHIVLPPYSEYRIHGDVAHIDGGGAAGHTDHTDQVVHTDIPPGAHVDSPHTDTHNDWGHGDSHTDSHSDTPHTDAHNDYHEDFTPPPGHSDCTIYQNGEYYAHGDFYDNISQGPYPCMWHDDTPHQDVAHNDSHADVPHHDDPGASDHTDIPHTDVPGGTHGDVPHTDQPHVDHSDAVHNDTPHTDNPVFIG